MTTRTVCVALALALTLLATHVASAQEYPEGWQRIKFLPASISGDWTDTAEGDPDLAIWQIGNPWAIRAKTGQIFNFNFNFAYKELPNGEKEYMAFVNNGDESLTIVRHSSQAIQLTTVDIDGKKRVFNLVRKE
jgi:hypothetical protein